MAIKKVLHDDPTFRVEPMEVLSAFHSNDIQDVFIVAKLKNGELEVACTGSTKIAYELMEEFNDNLSKGVYSA